MKVNVITPFSRSENFAALRDMLLAQGAASWTLLQMESERGPEFNTDDYLNVIGGDGWLSCRYLDVPPKTEFHPGMTMVNTFIQRGDFNPDERYTFFPDDNWYPPGLIERVSQCDEPMVVTSMKRGDHQPDGVSKHPAWGLVAAEWNMSFGHVGLEQAFFRGDVLNEMATWDIDIRVPNEYLLISASKKFETKYIPDLFVWFNWFEEGRWEK